MTTEEQIEIVGEAIALAGSVVKLADAIRVRRETVYSWYRGKYRMNLSNYMELKRWVRNVKSTKSTGNESQATAG